MTPAQLGSLRAGLRLLDDLDDLGFAKARLAVLSLGPWPGIQHRKMVYF